MAAARAAHEPHVPLDADPPLHDIPPAISRDAPRPRAAQWRAPRPPRRPLVRWLGIGACLVLVGLGTATMLTQPTGAELERLIRPWLEWPRSWQVATPQAEPVRPAAPEPAAARKDPPPRSMPPDPALQGRVETLASEAPKAPRQPDAVAPEGASAIRAGNDQTVRAVPVPSLKPAADQ